MHKELPEILTALHKVGWTDARVAVWISDQVRRDWMEGISIGPSSQSVYRWRRGTNKPHSEMYQSLIHKLYREICDEHQNNQD